jgi:hypothetical protein
LDCAVSHGHCGCSQRNVKAGIIASHDRNSGIWHTVKAAHRVLTAISASAWVGLTLVDVEAFGWAAAGFKPSIAGAAKASTISTSHTLSVDAGVAGTVVGHNTHVITAILLDKAILAFAHVAACCVAAVGIGTRAGQALVNVFTRSGAVVQILEPSVAFTGE